MCFACLSAFAVWLCPLPPLLPLLFFLRGKFSLELSIVDSIYLRILDETIYDNILGSMHPSGKF
jgi:hypothetical protein